MHDSLQPERPRALVSDVGGGIDAQTHPGAHPTQAELEVRNDPGSMRLAYLAHLANEVWNESVPYWNKSQKREGLSRARRSPYGAAIPEAAPFLPLSGQVRVPSDPRSTLYNTDGQIFSDAGVPCVLFMENYDINRVGYHDTHDTMALIDLDYGAAVCAISIEAVARAATEEPEEAASRKPAKTKGLRRAKA